MGRPASTLQLAKGALVLQIVYGNGAILSVEPLGGVEALKHATQHSPYQQHCTTNPGASLKSTVAQSLPVKLHEMPHPREGHF